MTEYLANGIGFVLALLALLWAGRVLLELAVDNHHRGMARVHRGQSWQQR